MSNEENTDPKEPAMVEPVSEQVSTDVVQEIKSGIFGLFINMYNHMSLKVGPQESMKYCILYLQEIIDHCQKALDGEINNNN